MTIDNGGTEEIGDPGYVPVWVPPDNPPPKIGEGWGGIVDETEVKSFGSIVPEFDGLEETKDYVNDLVLRRGII